MAADEAREAVEALELSVAMDDLCDTAAEGLADLVETRPGMSARDECDYILGIVGRRECRLNMLGWTGVADAGGEDEGRHC